jgi:hypothetical protein
VKQAATIVLSLLLLAVLPGSAAAANVSVVLRWHTSVLTLPGQPTPACTQPPAGTWASFFLKTITPGGASTSVVMKVDAMLEQSGSECGYWTDRFGVPEGLVRIIFTDGMQFRQCETFLEPGVVAGVFTLTFAPGSQGCSKSFVPDN